MGQYHIVKFEKDPRPIFESNTEQAIVTVRWIPNWFEKIFGCKEKDTLFFGFGHSWYRVDGGERPDLVLAYALYDSYIAWLRKHRYPE